MGEDGGAGAPETDGDGSVDTDARPATTADPPTQAAPADDFGWRGWVLVATIVVSFILIPAAILLLPAARGVISGFGLTLRDAYLVLPLPAAIVLGAVAVWSAVSARRES